VSAEEEFRRRWAGHVPAWMDARRRCAVLCPLCRTPEGLAFLFEVRAAGLRRQPGEACFPGGTAEPGETAEACALRETREELSIPPEHVQVVGQADFLCTQAGLFIQPVIGLLDGEALAAIRPSTAEVAETFTVPVSFFAEHAPELWRYELAPVPPENFPYGAVGVGPDYRWPRGLVEVPLWRFEGRAVWGMTARIVRGILRGMEEN
jgi:coenzyme A diphosphatase NUDT7